MTNTYYNTFKIFNLSRYANLFKTYLNERRYGVKHCVVPDDKIVLAAALNAVFCRFELDGDDETYCMTSDELCKMGTYIKNLQK